MRKTIVKCDKCGRDQDKMSVVARVYVCVRNEKHDELWESKDEIDLCESCIEDLGVEVRKFYGL